MYGKNSEKIQHVGHILRLREYYRVVKNKKETQVTMLKYMFCILQSHFSNIMYITWSI